MRVLANKKFVKNNRFVFSEIFETQVPEVSHQLNILSSQEKSSDKQSSVHAGEKAAIGEFISFRQLKGSKAKQSDIDNTDFGEANVNEEESQEEDYVSKLNRLVQLTGTSVAPRDPGRHLHRVLRQDEQVRHLPRARPHQPD